MIGTYWFIKNKGSLRNTNFLPMYTNLYRTFIQAVIKFTLNNSCLRLSFPYKFLVYTEDPNRRYWCSLLKSYLPFCWVFFSNVTSSFWTCPLTPLHFAIADVFHSCLAHISLHMICFFHFLAMLFILVHCEQNRKDCVTATVLSNEFDLHWK